MSWWDYKPYVSVAERRAKAEKKMAALRKKGQTISPVQIEGRTIARTFWGKAWCDHIESFSDYENRLPRGRTYVRNGSVIDLQIQPGLVTAMVSGSEIYTLKIKIKPLAPATWKSIKSQCAGQIGSMIELLQGRMSAGVMQIITRREQGMFPLPKEISMDCSCPDWAGLCKHLAAVLYGVGARLDEQPELLFTLRQVDPLELIEQAGSVETLTGAGAGTAGGKTIAAGDLADVFGIELDNSVPAAGAPGATEDAAVQPVEVRESPNAAATAGKGKKAKASTPSGSAKASARKTAKAKTSAAKAGAGRRESASAKRPASQTLR